MRDQKHQAEGKVSEEITEKDNGSSENGTDVQDDREMNFKESSTINSRVFDDGDEVKHEDREEDGDEIKEEGELSCSSSISTDSDADDKEAVENREGSDEDLDPETKSFVNNNQSSEPSSKEIESIEYDVVEEDERSVTSKEPADDADSENVNEDREEGELSSSDDGESSSSRSSSSTDSDVDDKEEAENREDSDESCEDLDDEPKTNQIDLEYNQSSGTSRRKKSIQSHKSTEEDNDSWENGTDVQALEENREMSVHI